MSRVTCMRHCVPAAPSRQRLQTCRVTLHRRTLERPAFVPRDDSSFAWLTPPSTPSPPLPPTHAACPPPETTSCCHSPLVHLQVQQQMRPMAPLPLPPTTCAAAVHCHVGHCSGCRCRSSARGRSSAGAGRQACDDGVESMMCCHHALLLLLLLLLLLYRLTVGAGRCWPARAYSLLRQWLQLWASRYLAESARASREQPLHACAVSCFSNNFRMARHQPAGARPSSCR